MLNFFQNIFSKAISLIASAIIAVGLVSMPAPQITKQSLPPEQPKEGIFLEVEQKELEPEKPLEVEIKPKREVNKQSEVKKQEKQTEPVDSTINPNNSGGGGGGGGMSCPCKIGENICKCNNGEVLPISGCIDKNAENYNPNAVQDDNSCVYSLQKSQCPVIEGYKIKCIDPYLEKAEKEFEINPTTELQGFIDSLKQQRQRKIEELERLGCDGVEYEPNLEITCG